MQKQIVLYNLNVRYSTRRSSRAKRLRLAVYCDGNFVVTLPKSFKEISAQKYIISRSKWILEKLDFFKENSKSKVFNLTSADFLKYKEETLMLVKRKIAIFNKRYEFNHHKISVRNQKTRWGSCSKVKNLNFNYKILFLPSKLQDYVIVHEMCHLKERNHSKKFWNLVGKTIPQYLSLNKEIKLFSLKF